MNYRKKNRKNSLSILLLLLMWIISLPSAAASLSDEDLLIKFAGGHQTTGIGNVNTVLLRATLPDEVREGSATLRNVSLDLTGAAELTTVKVYVTECDEFMAAENPLLIGKCRPASNLSIKLKTNKRMQEMHYLWVTADVSQRASFGRKVRVKVKSVSCFRQNRKVAAKIDGLTENTLTIFKRQHALFVPTTGNCRFYRIPAMIVACDTIIVACDKRYDSNSDLGNHKIDLVRRFSTDNGRTWSEPLVFAHGDGKTQSAFGFGDPVLLRCKSGKLLCLMAAGKDSFWGHMVFSCMCESTDGGNTWTRPQKITVPDHFEDQVTGQRGLGVDAFFVTSGKGHTTASGRVMALAVVRKVKGGSLDNYVLYTDDEGQNWTLDSTMVYHHGDEAKIVTRRDGSLLASIRTKGQRGFNVGSADGTRWAVSTTSPDLVGADCNADILAYDNGLMIHSLLKERSPRKDLRIYSSTDDGSSWTERLQVQTGNAGYSTLSRLPNGDLAVFYEDGTLDDNGYTLNWVTIPAAVVETWKK